MPETYTLELHGRTVEVVRRDDGKFEVPDFVRRWIDRGTSCKSAYEPIVVAMKPCAGTFAENAERFGVAGLNVDGCRIGTGEAWSGSEHGSGPSVALSGGADGSLNNQRSGSHSLGRWPANLVLGHSPECAMLGTRRVKGSRVDKPCPNPEIRGDRWGTMQGNRGPRGHGDEDGREEVEVYRCAPGCPVAMLDEQSGDAGGGFGIRGDKRGSVTWGCDGSLSREDHLGITVGFGDSGGASRFFYTAKVSTAERNLGMPAGVTNKHPTLKPIALTTWLAKLLLPPARETPRRLLVPFAGTGSEVIGALAAGWDEVVGVEREAEYAEWARHRIAGKWWRKPEPRRAAPVEQSDLFGDAA